MLFDFSFHKKGFKIEHVKSFNIYCSKLKNTK